MHSSVVCPLTANVLSSKHYRGETQTFSGWVPGTSEIPDTIVQTCLVQCPVKPDAFSELEGTLDHLVASSRPGLQGAVEVHLRPVVVGRVRVLEHLLEVAPVQDDSGGRISSPIVWMADDEKKNPNQKCEARDSITCLNIFNHNNVKG